MTFYLFIYLHLPLAQVCVIDFSNMNWVIKCENFRDKNVGLITQCRGFKDENLWNMYIFVDENIIIVVSD